MIHLYVRLGYNQGYLTSHTQIHNILEKAGIISHLNHFVLLENYVGRYVPNLNTNPLATNNRYIHIPKSTSYIRLYKNRV